MKVCLYLEQEKMDPQPNNNIVGSAAAGSSVLEYPEMGGKGVGVQNVVIEKFRAEGLLRQVNISREAETVCKDIEFYISSEG